MSPQTGPFLAVVPARGGSKRIPRKNIRPFCGVPLLGRTLEVVVATGIFDAVVVSTDDLEIADVARAFGALVPFTRPAELSDDSTATRPVVEHAIDAVSAKLGEFASVCCIYPGAVLMTEADYSASSDLVELATGHSAVVAAVVRYGHPIQRALRRLSDGLLEPQSGQQILVQRTQDLEPTWHDAGQFYWATPDRWRRPDPLLSVVVPYEIPSWRAQDIDTEDDWVRAEMMFTSARTGADKQGGAHTTVGASSLGQVRESRDLSPKSEG